MFNNEDRLQFYPTPRSLAEKAWKKFKNRTFTRVLDPEAGNGDLVLDGILPVHCDGKAIDCCEIDISRHTILRARNRNVVGFDFMEFSCGSIYSHIIMNPPFNVGVAHTLKAWDILYDGEIVAIINAESIRNPTSKERQALVRLIEDHGEVEFLQETFIGEDAIRKTNVEIALIYLCKKADASADILGRFYAQMSQDPAYDTSHMHSGLESQMILPASQIENRVRAFDLSVEAMREAVQAEAAARFYANFLGETMAVLNGGGSKDLEFLKHSSKWIRNTFAERYADLKDRAWAGILRSSDVLSRLSSKAQQRMEKEFDGIKKLEFTLKNIYGFLLGLIEGQGDIQRDMVCDIFDSITRYHSDNTVFYRGWKSNDKHRTCGMRVKTTRFILPGHSTHSWASSPSWDSMRMLADFDKVFAMLDGKSTPEVSLQSLFQNHFDDLRAGDRLTSSYFDVRYYQGVGTIHFFPRDAKLIERFNRVVGRYRQWLPDENLQASESFWAQYADAQKFDAAVRKEVSRSSGTVGYCRSAFSALFSREEEELNQGSQILDQALEKVQAEKGLYVDFRLQNNTTAAPALAHRPQLPAKIAA